jgi:hypothetical protein
VAREIRKDRSEAITYLTMHLSPVLLFLLSPALDFTGDEWLLKLIKPPGLSHKNLWVISTWLSTNTSLKDSGVKLSGAGRATHHAVSPALFLMPTYLQVVSLVVRRRVFCNRRPGLQLEMAWLR